jgi:glycosyltransferase involved in cell wall biosynthesis
VALVRLEEALRSRRLAENRRRGFDAVVTLDFSAARTFQVLRDTGALRVLDFIDNHPRYPEPLLERALRAAGSSPELVFPEVIGRIENELELADLVLVPSRFVARQLEPVGIPAERVVIERFGVDASAFHPPEGNEKPRRRDVARCLFVG